jgi:hypothetical protein
MSDAKRQKREEQSADVPVEDAGGFSVALHHMTALAGLGAKFVHKAILKALPFSSTPTTTAHDSQSSSALTTAHEKYVMQNNTLQKAAEDLLYSMGETDKADVALVNDPLNPVLIAELDRIEKDIESRENDHTIINTQLQVAKKNLEEVLRTHISRISTCSRGETTIMAQEQSARQHTRFTGPFMDEKTIDVVLTHERLNIFIGFERVAGVPVHDDSQFSHCIAFCANFDANDGKYQIRSVWRELYEDPLHGMQLARGKETNNTAEFKRRTDTDFKYTPQQMQTVQNRDEFRQLVTIYSLMAWPLPEWMVDWDG